MKKVLWFSRHPALPNQIEELQKMYGNDVKIIQYGKKVASAEDIVKIYQQEQADDMVVVAPLSVLAVLCEKGMNPLYAQMERVPLKEAEVTVSDRGFKFVKFRRIKKVILEFFD